MWIQASSERKLVAQITTPTPGVAVGEPHRAPLDVDMAGWFAELSGLAASLADDELDAVLAHEAEHARRRDPLRRLAGRAAAEVLFWLPLVNWWSRGRLEDAELAADRAAIRRVGRPSLARALRATAIPTGATAGVGFDGAGPARVTQLLGDQPPRRRPPLAACLLSGLGLTLAVSLAMCVGQGLASAIAS